MKLGIFIKVVGRAPSLCVRTHLAPGPLFVGEVW